MDFSDHETGHGWLLLVYRVPREPTRLRERVAEAEEYRRRLPAELGGSAAGVTDPRTIAAFVA